MRYWVGCLLFVMFLASCADGATVRRTEMKEGGGVEIIVAEDPDCPVYLSPDIVKPNYEPGATADSGKLTADGLKLVDQVLAQRAAGKLAAVKEAAIETALSAELAKRKAAAGDLTTKTPTEAVTAVFGTAVGAPK